MMRPRILVIGAGMVGSTSAASIASRRLGTVYLHDVVEDLALGRAMDINHSLPSSSSDSRVVGCNTCLLYTSPSPRDRTRPRMPSSA